MLLLIGQLLLSLLMEQFGWLGAPRKRKRRIAEGVPQACVTIIDNEKPWQSFWTVRAYSFR